MSVKIDVSIVIVNYNSTKELKDCIDSLLKTVTRLRYEIIIVDNKSNDQKSIVDAFKKYPSVKFLLCDRNLGWAGGNNLGMRNAHGSVVLVLNPDTIMIDDAVKTLYDFLTTRKNIGIVGPLIFNESNEIDLYCARKSPDLLTELFDHTGLERAFKKNRIFGRYLMGYWDHGTTREIELISGSCMMVKKQLIETVGYMDERFFLYGDDVEWCYRFRKLGYKILFCHSAKIIHIGGRSTNPRRKTTILIALESMYKFFKFHHSKGMAIMYRILILCVYATKSIFCWITPRRTNFFTYYNMILWAIGALRFEQDSHGNPFWKGLRT